MSQTEAARLNWIENFIRGIADDVHDCFTIAEVIAYEDLGFCGPSSGASGTASWIPTRPAS